MRVLGRAERLFVHRPIVFALGAATFTLGSGLLISNAAVSAGAGRDVLHPFAPLTLAHQLIAAVGVAPPLENTLLWLAFNVAGTMLALAAPSLSPTVRARSVGALLAFGFALLHRDQSPLWGAPMLPLAATLLACFAWGQRHGRSLRGLGVSIAVHALHNLGALALYRLA